MFLFAMVLVSLLLGVSNLDASTPNQKLALWDQQRKGTNGGGGSDRRVPGAQEYLTELIAQINSHDWHWAFYSFRGRYWDGLDYELGTQKLGWEYWQEREKGVDYELLIERHDNPLWEVLRREFPETRSSSPD